MFATARLVSTSRVLGRIKKCEGWPLPAVNTASVQRV